MEQFVIEGGHRLNGTLQASGNKNAALKLIAACLLTDEVVTLRNVPDIADVRVMCDLVRSLGADIMWQSAGILRLHAKSVVTHRPDPQLVQKIRASIVLAGPMLARCGRLELAAPGGDVIGRRRLDTHILALQQLGAEVEFTDRFLMKADKLTGAKILLDEASVTATENVLMAAVLAKGTTIIRNAASEPHVQDMCNFLNILGAQISGVGSNMLTIQGVERLHGGDFRVGADFMEVGSFIGAAVVTGGSVRITNADPQHLDMMQLVLRRLGVSWDVEGEDVIVSSAQSLTIIPDLGNRIPVIKAQPWPAFPSDMMSIALLIATQARGAVLFHEWMYDARFFFTDKLVGMGARIVLCDPHRALVYGPTKLHGNLTITSPDIRAGMTLLLAALCADGVTTIRNIGQIDRGYEHVEEKLRALGAQIERVPIHERV
ncbi:MAG: UDP-N-acetylglucosamine 1-carboxyvinyltransferase [Chloroflexota bacterium]